MEARRTGARGPCVLQRVWTRGDTRGSRTAAAVVSRSCRAGSYASRLSRSEL
jgi:hypothetical protein